MSARRRRSPRPRPGSSTKVRDAAGGRPRPHNIPPPRRAVRALRDAFLEAAGGRAVLLPSIRALGNPDEDEAIIFGGEGNAEEGFAGASGARGIGPLERGLALVRLPPAPGEKEAARGAGRR